MTSIDMRIEPLGDHRDLNPLLILSGIAWGVLWMAESPGSLALRFVGAVDVVAFILCLALTIVFGCSGGSWRMEGSDVVNRHRSGKGNR